jgi:hypothetical protein
MDSSSLIMVVDWLSFLCLLSCHIRSAWFYRLTLVIAAVWAVDCGAGLWKLNRDAWIEAVPERAFDQGLWLRSARAFLATDDPRVFQRRLQIEQIHPRPEKVCAVLRDPRMRAILPACIREPLRVVQANRGDTGFVPLSDTKIQWDTPAGPGWSSHPATNRAGSKFESLPLGPSSLPYLEFPVAGDLRAAGVALALLDLRTGRTNALRPSQSLAGERWQIIGVKAPLGKFKILAANRSQVASFAFKEPREAGWLSEWTVRILAAWKIFLWAGLAALLLNAASLLNRRRVEAPAPTGSFRETDAVHTALS